MGWPKVFVLMIFLAGLCSMSYYLGRGRGFQEGYDKSNHEAERELGNIAGVYHRDLERIGGPATQPAP